MSFTVLLASDKKIALQVRIKAKKIEGASDKFKKNLFEIFFLEKKTAITA